MPIDIEFEFEKPSGSPRGSPKYNLSQNQRSRIQSLFVQFGWEMIGPSRYRYPRASGTKHVGPEDWPNDVVPAHFLFRSAALQQSLKLKRRVILTDRTFSRFDEEKKINVSLKPTKSVRLQQNTDSGSFGRDKLEKWLGNVDAQYPYPD